MLATLVLLMKIICTDNIYKISKKTTHLNVKYLKKFLLKLLLIIFVLLKKLKKKYLLLASSDCQWNTSNISEGIGIKNEA